MSVPVLARYAALLAYPAGTGRARLRDALADPPAPMAALAEAVRCRTPEELEELYTRTFDINPVCSLEVGWHLFGEDYNRGALLVRFRGLLREHGIEEGPELPDHLATVLHLLARLPGDEARALSRRCVLPAVEKMGAGLAGKDSPYADVLRGLEAYLRAEFGAPEPPRPRTQPYACASTCAVRERGGA